MKFNNEEFRPVVGFGGFYEVSNLGRIRNVRSGRFLSPSLHVHGYRQVTFSAGGKITSHRVHKLVAMAFLPNPRHYKIVHHRDFDRQNNVVSNLAWCDHEMNSGFSSKRMGTKKIKMSEEKVLQVAQRIRQALGSEVPRNGGVWQGIANEFGLTLYDVVDIRDGRRWSSLTGFERKRRKMII